MKAPERMLVRLTGLTCLLSAPLMAECRATEPTLARLSFWVPPEQIAEFEATYDKQVMPILKRYDLVPSSELGRATVDSVFARVFEFKTPVEFEDVRRAMLSDPTFEEFRRSSGVAFGTSDSRGLIRLVFEIYRSPAGHGKQVAAGPGHGYWRTYGVPDGLAHNRVWSIFQDQEGLLWFGTYGGVSRYNGETFTTFNTQDGLAHNIVRRIFQDREGLLWFGADGGGVSRYDGETFTTFTTQDGLAHNRVFSVLQDREGLLWFGTDGGGVSRYDGKTFTTFNTQDGLADNSVWSIFQDREGLLWFGTDGGVSRYDGETFTTLATQDGLARNTVWSILQDREGLLWFGTRGGGVSRYDGEAFTSFTIQDGLADNSVWSILQDREGLLWFGTAGSGVSRYDGEAFTSFAAQDGLSHNSVVSILQDRRGVLWFGTDGGGVSRYDGKIFTTLTAQDGLAHNIVLSIFQDGKGWLWFGTDGGGVTRYRPPAPTPPPVFIDAVLADRRYEGVSEIAIPSTVELTIFEFHGRSFKTRPEAMIYRYRLKGYQEDWETTRARRVEYQNLRRGTYTFQIQAVDRDLGYSEAPATVKLTVHLPYTTIALVGSLGFAVIALGFVSVYAVRRRQDLRRAEQALRRELEEELQTAHDMQMALMPNKNPEIEGFDIAGLCVPANLVGGDFFKYFQRDNKLALCMADVTGHAMEAAIPVVMFSGILESEIQHGTDPQALFSRLNRTLSRILDNRTFVCFSLGELDLSNHTLRLGNAACPYPYHFHGETGEVNELQVEAYPLGIRSDTTYDVIETQLHPGDKVVFLSDGITEAEDVDGEQLGYERTAEIIQKVCQTESTAEAIIDRILEAVGAFKGDASQLDDMTCVVLRVE